MNRTSGAHLIGLGQRSSLKKYSEQEHQFNRHNTRQREGGKHMTELTYA